MLNKIPAYFFLACYVITRWSFNFAVRFYVWIAYLILMTFLGIIFPRIWEAIVSVETFMNKHFTLNPQKFLVVKWALEDINSSSSFYDEIPKTNIIEPEQTKSNLDSLKNGILNILNTPDT